VGEDLPAQPPQESSLARASASRQPLTGREAGKSLHACRNHDNSVPPAPAFLPARILARSRWAPAGDH